MGSTLLTLEQHTTETSEMLDSANHMFRIIALRTRRYLHNAMTEGRMKKLLKTEAKTMLKDRQVAGGILEVFSELSCSRS